MNEFFARLKQRKVVQWSLAYIAAAFALIQVLDIIAQQFGWPDGVRRGITIALAIGFCITLVLAWYHGEQGAQRISGVELLFLALLLTIGGGLLWRVAQSPRSSASDAGVAAPAAANNPIIDKSIAVLPFDNLSHDPDNAYFAEGIQDEILTRLAGIGDLKVISRTSTKRYQSKPDNLKSVANELGVANILEGSVQKAGDAVRVNVQLIDARNDAHLWAQTFDRELKNVFVVESEVAQQIADVLKARMSARETQALAKPPTQNSLAYDHFLRAEFEAHRAQSIFEDADFRAADAEYRQAIALDRDFATAFARMAYNRLAQHWFVRRLTALELAEVKGWIDRALALAPELPAAHSALGFYYYWGLREFDHALAEFHKVLELAPNDISAPPGIGFIERRLGHWPEALASLQRAISMSPRDGTLLGEYGITLVLLRRYPEGEVQLRRVREIDPEDTGSRDFLLRELLFGVGDVAAARASFEAPPAWRIAYHNLLAGDLFWLVNARAYPDLFERHFDAALQQWDSAPQGTQEERLTQRVARVAIKLVANDKQSVHAECAALAPVLQAQVEQHPDSLSLLQQISWIDVCLGRNAEAIAAARHATELMPLAKDKYFGLYQLEGLAEIDAHAGAPDEAFKLLEQMLRMPVGEPVSIERLKRDPLWDPLRGDPRFDALLRKTDTAAAVAAH